MSCLNLYAALLLFLNIMAIVVGTRNTLREDLRNKLLLLANATNGTNIEAATPFEYQFMSVVAQGFDAMGKALDIVEEVHAEKILCGGTIIHKDWVVTAARCFPTNLNSHFLRIYAGIVDMMYRFEGQQIRSAKLIYTHPHFDNLSDEYNIAMIKVTQSFIMTKYVNKIRLPSKPMVPSGTEGCYILKFIRGLNVTNSNVTRLYKVPTRVLTKLECSDRLEILKIRTRNIADKNFCLISFEHFHYNQGACKKDVGNPCICGNNLQGLIGYTTPETCFQIGYPTTVTDIGAHLSWIRGKILKLNYVPQSSSMKMFNSEITITYFTIMLHLRLTM